MRRSLGQKMQADEQGHGLVSTVMVATPEAVRRGLRRSVRSKASSSVGVTFHEAQRVGPSAFDGAVVVEQPTLGYVAGVVGDASVVLAEQGVELRFPESGGGVRCARHLLPEAVEYVEDRVFHA